jgi:hypothetical protein
MLVDGELENTWKETVLVYIMEQWYPSISMKNKTT